MFGQSLNSILATWGYLAVFTLVALEASGIPFPGETILVAGAVYAGNGGLKIPFVIAAAAIGATVGFCVSYSIGRTGGRAIVLRYGHFVRLDQANLEKAERFFNRHGEKTVFLGRFVSVGRAVVALLAGINKMNLPKFMLFNVLGAVAWACIFGVAGFELGHNLPLLHKLIRAFTVVGVVAVVAVILIGGVWYWRHNRTETQG